MLLQWHLSRAVPCRAVLSTVSTLALVVGLGGRGETERVLCRVASEGALELLADGATEMHCLPISATWHAAHPARCRAFSCTRGG